MPVLMATFDGGCFCGKVRYRLTDRPMFTNCCHCTDCQIQTGGAFAINAMIEATKVEMLGEEPIPVRMPTESGQPHDIHRCPHCQTALWSIYGGRQAVRFMRVSTLDDRHAITPDVHIFTRSKVPWVQLPDDVPAFEVYYDAKTLWPPESLERRKAALAAG
jgi:hypothetical protein